MFALVPVKRLSMTVTSWPASSRRRARWEPMNPAPPVMRDFLVIRVCVLWVSILRGRRSEIGGQRSEVSGQRSEVGGRRLEVGSRRIGIGGQIGTVGRLVNAQAETFVLFNHPAEPFPN